VPLLPADGVRLLDRLVGQGDALTACAALRLDVPLWRAMQPRIATRARFSAIVSKGGAPTTADRGALRRELEPLGAGARRRRLEAYLRRELGGVLRLAAARIEPGTPFGALGLDSLMSLELKNRFEVALDLKLPVSLLFGQKTITALSAHLLEGLGMRTDTSTTPEHGGAATPPEPEPALLHAELNEEEAEAALLARLDALDLDGGTP